MKKLLLYLFIYGWNNYALADNKMLLNQHGSIQAQVIWTQNEYQEDILFGDIKFKPNSSTKICRNISFIQIAKVIDNKNKDLVWDKISGQSNRNLIKTKNNWFLDHDATKCDKNKSCSKFFIDHWANDCSYGSKLSNDDIMTAQIKDYPFGWTQFSDIELESCAVCKDSNEIFSCVKWGASWPLMGDRKIKNIEVSQAPSLDFIEAINLFDSFYKSPTN